MDIHDAVWVADGLEQLAGDLGLGVLSDVASAIRFMYDQCTRTIPHHDLLHDMKGTVLASATQLDELHRRLAQGHAEFSQQHRGKTATVHHTITAASLTKMQQERDMLLQVGSVLGSAADHFSAGRAAQYVLEGLLIGILVTAGILLASGGTTAPATAPALGVEAAGAAGSATVVVTEVTAGTTLLGSLAGFLGVSEAVLTESLVAGAISWLAVDTLEVTTSLSADEIIAKLGTAFATTAEEIFNEVWKGVEKGAIAIEDAEEVISIVGALLALYPALGIQGAIALARAIVAGAIKAYVVYDILSKVCPIFLGDIADRILNAYDASRKFQYAEREQHLLDKLAELTQRAQNGDEAAQRVLSAVRRIGLNRVADLEFDLSKGEIDILLQDPATGNLTGAAEVGNFTKATYVDQLQRAYDYLRSQGVQNPELVLDLEQDPNDPGRDLTHEVEQALKNANKPWRTNVRVNTPSVSERETCK